jgi:hypothetical protein
MSRGHNSTIIVTKEGYQEGDVVLSRRADTPWFFWDIATCIIHRGHVYGPCSSSDNGCIQQEASALAQTCG